MPIAMQYGSGNYTAQNMPQSGGGGSVSGIEIKLLWTNPSPDANFAAQTIPLDLSGYDMVGIEIRFSKSTNATYRQLAFGLMGSTLSCTYRAFGSNTVVSRRADTSQSGVEFYNGYSGTTADASNAIPTRIYGIKGIT